jgi:hypothetical protein
MKTKTSKTPTVMKEERQVTLSHGLHGYAWEGKVAIYFTFSDYDFFFLKPIFSHETKQRPPLNKDHQRSASGMGTNNRCTCKVSW